MKFSKIKNHTDFNMKKGYGYLGIKVSENMRCQVSINIRKPGITKGQHWHNSKWEQFIVVHGHGLIQERNINTGEMVEFEVSGDKIEAIYMIPGWTHNIINLSDTEVSNLVSMSPAVRR